MQYQGVAPPLVSPKFCMRCMGITADYDEDWNLKQAALHSHRPSKLLHSIEETPVSQWWSVVEGVENEPRQEDRVNVDPNERT